jgi:hypothetical protein
MQRLKLLICHSGTGLHEKKLFGFVISLLPFVPPP